LRAKTKDRLLAVAAVAIIYLFVAMTLGGGQLDPRKWAFLQTGQVPTVPTPPPPGVTEGIVTTDTAAFDSLDIATSRTVGTDVKVYWYALRGGNWVLLGSGDAADINVQEEDRNLVYVVTAIPSDKYFYVDYQKILSMNDRAQAVEYKDIDGDNVEEYVFKLNVADIPFASGTGKYSLPSFNVYLLSYDSSFAWPTAGKPSDISSVGTAKVTKYIEWYVSLSAEKKALALAEVELKVNTSDTSKVTLKKLNIPGIGYLDGSSFSQSVLSSEIKWTYKISSLLYGANYIKLPVNTLNKFEFTTTIEVDLETGDKLNFTLTFRYFDNTESLKSASDSVLVSA